MPLISPYGFHVFRQRNHAWRRGKRVRVDAVDKRLEHAAGSGLHNGWSRHLLGEGGGADDVEAWAMGNHLGCGLF